MPVDRATLELFVPLDRGAPLRAQLEDAICAAITGGGAPPGTRLPASRVLAETLGVSRGVVSEAYAQIAAEGWIEVRHGAAPVVRALPAASGAPERAANTKEPGPFKLDLTATAPDLSAFPRRAWAAALRKVLAEMPDAALDYGDPRGDDELRRELAAYLVQRMACGDSEDIGFGIVYCFQLFPMLPYLYKYFVGDLFGQRRSAYHFQYERIDASVVSAEQLSEGRFIPPGYPVKQLMIRILGY